MSGFLRQLSSRLSRPFGKKPSQGEVVAVGFDSESLDRMLAILGPQHREAAEKYIPDVVEAMAAQGGRGLLRSKTARARKARAEAEVAQSQADASRATRQEAEQAVKQLAGGSAVRGLLFLVCCAVGIAAEMALNLGTLPFLLDASPRSVLGIALAAAPTTAVLILDIILERVLEDPFRNRHLLGPRGRIVVWTAMGIFMALVAALIFGNVLLYGEARERARDIVANGAEIDAGLLRKTVLALSVLVALASAWFCTLATAELRAWRKLRRARANLKQAERAAQQTDEAAKRARSEADTAAAEAEHAVDDAEAAARQFRAEKQLRLAIQLQARIEPVAPPAAATTDELIAQGLRRRMARRSGVIVARARTIPCTAVPVRTEA
jgi:hypothetical protein